MPELLKVSLLFGRLEQVSAQARVLLWQDGEPSVQKRFHLPAQRFEEWQLPKQRKAEARTRRKLQAQAAQLERVCRLNKHRLR